MINRVQGSENSRERTPWPNRRYDARQSFDNIVHLPSGKHGMSAKGSENKTVAQGDDKVACPSAVLMFRGFMLLTLFHGLIRFVLEYGDGVHQNHAGPKVLADAVSGFARKLFNTKFPFQLEIHGFDTPAQRIQLNDGIHRQVKQVCG